MAPKPKKNLTVNAVEDLRSSEDVKKLIRKDRDFGCSALLSIYSLQTDDEKENNVTLEKNSAGFNATDAPEMSRYARLVMKLQGISATEYQNISAVLMKYAGQILRLIMQGNLVEFKCVKNVRDNDFFNERIAERQREQDAKWEEKKKKRMETVKIEVEKKANSQQIAKISFRYHEDIVSEIKSTGKFRYDPEHRFWYADYSAELVETILSFSFISVQHKTYLNDFERYVQ